MAGGDWTPINMDVLEKAEALLEGLPGWGRDGDGILDKALGNGECRIVYEYAARGPMIASRPAISALRI